MKPATTIELKHLFLLAAITTLLVLPIFTDPVNLPKFVFLLSTSFSLAYFVGALSFKRVRIKVNFVAAFKVSKEPVTLSLSLFLLAVLLSALLSQSPLTGIFGLSGRRNGFLTYLALFAVFLIAKKIGTKASLFHYLKALAYVGSIQAIYMLFQYFNLDPLPWETVYENKMFGTFGNPNFSSAFLAVSLPAIIFCALSQSISRSTQIFFRMSTALTLIVMYLANVYQGPFSVVIAGVITYFVFIQMNSSRQVLKNFSYAGLFGSALTLVLGILKIGPLSGIFSKSSFEIRSQGYWPVAIELGLSKPFFGVGHEQFVNYFPRAFNPAYRSRFGQFVTDNAHNYLFHFFAEGGILLFVSYLAFLFFVSRLIFKLCAETVGGRNPIHLAVVGIWTAFLAQMLVSIDSLGFSVWIWILAGLLVGSICNTTYSHDDSGLGKKRGKALRGSVATSRLSTKSYISLGSSFLIMSIFTQLAWLDNRVWFLESARKQGVAVVVTESDIKSLRTRSQLWPFDPLLLARSSSLLLSYGFTEEGFALLNKTLSRNPDSPSLLNLRAVATESMINRSLATKMRIRELEMDPWNITSSIELIRNLQSQGNLVAAEQEFIRLRTFADELSLEIASRLLPNQGPRS